MRTGRGAGVLIGVALLAAGCAAGGGIGVGGTLAKIDEWRESLVPDAPFAVLELAYDEETARTMWDENVGDHLPHLVGDPVAPGIYGALEDVDLTEKVVGLYSSGQSGSCPGWVSDIETRHDSGTVAITTTQDLQGGDGCTDDYNAYRVLVVIDRGDVPDPATLGTVSGIVDGNEALDALVGEYPLTP